jgi:hypothetical protein
LANRKMMLGFDQKNVEVAGARGHSVVAEATAESQRAARTRLMHCAKGKLLPRNVRFIASGTASTWFTSRSSP